MAFTQNIGQWVKKHWLLSAVLVLLIAGAFQAYTLYFPNPFKVTDPNSAFFNPLKFDGKDYRGNPDLLRAAAQKAMPQGTDISVIRTIMKNNSSCLEETREKKNSKFVHYICSAALKFPTGTNYIYLFDENDKLVDYFANGSRGIYTDKFPEEIRNGESR